MKFVFLRLWYDYGIYGNGNSCYFRDIQRNTNDAQKSIMSQEMNPLIEEVKLSLGIWACTKICITPWRKWHIRIVKKKRTYVCTQSWKTKRKKHLIFCVWWGMMISNLFWFVCPLWVKGVWKDDWTISIKILNLSLNLV